MLMPRFIVFAAMLVSGASGLAQSTFPDHCDDRSPLPFASIEVKHPIDGICGIKGKPTSPPNSQLQNTVKNNFCSVPGGGGPETFTPQMLIDLQHKTTIPSGHGKEPDDRGKLKDLGEGKVVRMKANLIEAHHADLGNGESVNCNGGNEEDNDIHIALGPQPDTEECDSVSAEISPHFRPASWNEIGHFETFSSSIHKNVVNPGLAARLQAHPYRITGQLFFDASHEPCPCGTACDRNPVRSSGWEIHPVYGIEVCKSGTSCNETDDNDWQAFDVWWKSLVPLQPVKPPHTHHPHEK